jgi:hypothetical protein
MGKGYWLAQNLEACDWLNLLSFQVPKIGFCQAQHGQGQDY